MEFGGEKKAAKNGIQSFQAVVDHLDSSRTRFGIYRSDDFLRMPQVLLLNNAFGNNFSI